MKNRFLLTALLTFFFYSCDSSKKEVKSTETNSTSDDVTLTIEAKFLLNDKFQIYYTKEPNVELSGEFFFDKYVYGSDQMQKVTFKFPKGVIPYKIRLDLGENNEQKNMSIKNIFISYKDNLINGDDGEFMSSWTPNESLIYNNKQFLYDIVLINGLHDPLLISNVNIEKKLLKFRKDN